MRRRQARHRRRSRRPLKPEILRRIARLIAPIVRGDLNRFGEDMGTTRDDIALMYQEMGINPVESMMLRVKRFGKERP